VRVATDTGIELDTYGRSSGFCIDPIEKKPLAHFLPGTPVLSFGTAGCNLGCRFCQNWDISKARDDDRLTEVASPHSLAAAAVAHGCRSVAFTYNDPVIFAEYALDVATECRAVDVKTVAVTAGYISAGAREEFFAGMDAANIDLKAFTEEFYDKLCFARLGPVLDTIEYAVTEAQTWVELTTLLIEGANDSSAEIDQLTRWVADRLGPDVPLHFTAYHPDFKLRDRARTTAATLRRARQIAKGNGLHHVYTGNVVDPEGGSTWCSGCGALLIERDWYQLGHWGLHHGACTSCGVALPGVFEDRPGTWGRRRQPISMGQ
jgi:pyruvate formate lyase activating enzyme